MKPLRHAKAILFVHLVWGPRHRQDVLDEEFWALMSKLVIRLSNAEQFTIIASNGTEDHVHVLVEHRPDIPVSAIVKRIKGSLTHEIRRRIPEFSWQDGYGAFSVSPTAVAQVKLYIDKQKEHHAKGNTKIEWEDGVDT